MLMILVLIFLYSSETKLHLKVVVVNLLPIVVLIVCKYFTTIVGFFYIGLEEKEVVICKEKMGDIIDIFSHFSTSYLFTSFSVIHKGIENISTNDNKIRRKRTPLKDPPSRDDVTNRVTNDKDIKPNRSDKIHKISNETCRKI